MISAFSPPSGSYVLSTNVAPSEMKRYAIRPARSPNRGSSSAIWQRKRIGSLVARLMGHCGSVSQTGWPPNLVTRRASGASTSRKLSVYFLITGCSLPSGASVPSRRLRGGEQRVQVGEDEVGGAVAGRGARLVGGGEAGEDERG